MPEEDVRLITEIQNQLWLNQITREQAVVELEEIYKRRADLDQTGDMNTLFYAMNKVNEWIELRYGEDSDLLFKPEEIPIFFTDPALPMAPSRQVAVPGVDPEVARAAQLFERSLERAERLGIFGGLLQAQPGWGQLNPLAQRGLTRAFEPLSAQYALGAALAQSKSTPGIPSFGQDFRSWMGENPQQWGAADWRSQLGPVTEAFRAFEPEAGAIDITPEQLRQGSIRSSYSTEAAQDRLMAAVLGQGISPFLTRYIPDVITERRRRIGERAPEIDPFKSWITNPESWK